MSIWDRTRHDPPIVQCNGQTDCSLFFAVYYQFRIASNNIRWRFIIVHYNGSGARFFHFLTALSAGFMAMMPASRVTSLPEISKETAVPALGTILSLEIKVEKIRMQLLQQYKVFHHLDWILLKVYCGLVG